MRRTVVMLGASAALVTASASRAQTVASSRAQASATQDSVMARIRVEAQERSQLYPLAQTLMDSIGPRLTGSVR